MDSTPDLEFMAQQYTRKRDGINIVLDTIERKGVDHFRVGMLASDVWMTLAYGWVAQRPIDELRDSITAGVTGMREGLAAGIDPDPIRASRTMCGTLVAGDQVAAALICRHVLTLDIQDPPNDLMSHQLAAVAALVIQDPEAAGHHTATLAELLDSPTTPPDVAQRVTGLERMLAAVVDRDQDAFTTACDARATHVESVMQHDGNAARKIEYFFDVWGVAICRLAHAAGLQLPADQSIFAADLIATL